MEMLISIVERIKHLLELKSMSSSTLADELGITRSRISHMLTGRNNPSLEIIYSILSHYNDINPDWLLFGTGDPLRDSDKLENDVNDYEQTIDTNDLEIDDEPNLFNYDERLNNTEEALSKSELPSSESIEIKEDRDDSKIKSVLILFQNGKYEYLVPEK